MSSVPLRDRLYRTEAIVLRRLKIGEADRILTLYTPHLGKIRVVAKGVRKITSHMGGHVELFNRSKMLIAKARNLDVVTQVETIDAYRLLRDDERRVAHAFYIAELVDRLVPEEQEQYPVYKLLTETLEYLNGNADPELLVRWYEIQLLGYMGYRPELESCIVCRRPLEPVVNAFSPAQGGVLCPDCKRIGVAKDLSVTAFKVLRLMQRSAWADVARVRVQPQVREEIELALRAYISYVLEREPRSMLFLKLAEQVDTNL